MLHVNSTQMVVVAVKVDEIARDRIQNKNMIDQRAGFPCGSAGKDHLNLQCGRPGFDTWVGKIPWRRERLPTQVFWPGEFHGQSMGLQRAGHN